MTEKNSCISTITFQLRRDCDTNNNNNNTLRLEPLQPLVEIGRKQVRFADEEGQELCKVLEVTDDVEESKNNVKVVRGSKGKEACLAHSRMILPRKRGMRMLYCLEGNSDVRQAVEKMMICLESAACSSTFVFGVIAVKNVPYDKTVTVRYSFDKWKTLREIVAQFFLRDEYGSLDRFFFVIDLKRRPYKCMPLEIVLKYTTSRTEYWDNNGGKNYKFDVQSLVTEERKATRTEMLF